MLLMLYTAFSLLHVLQNAGIHFAIGGDYRSKARIPLNLDVFVAPEDWTPLIEYLARKRLGTSGKTQQGKDVYIVVCVDLPIQFLTESHPPGFGYKDLLEKGYELHQDGLQFWSEMQMMEWQFALLRLPGNVDHPLQPSLPSIPSDADITRAIQQR
jgi:hypothetical protein